MTVQRRAGREGEQLSLLGFEPAPPTDRLFFAIFPDADAAGELADRARRLRGDAVAGTAVAADRLHVTLNHLGDYDGLPRDIVAKALTAGPLVEASAFRVSFDRAESFGRPFVLRHVADDASPLAAFQKGLGEAMARAGLGRHVERNFTPHVTLFYDERPRPPTLVEPVSWRVEEFALVHSLLGQTRHVILERWPLRG